MKTFITALCLLISSVSFAKMTTQDRIGYSVTLNANLTKKQASACAKKVCSFADTSSKASCQYLSFVGVVTVDLTYSQAHDLSKLIQCVQAIEETLPTEANPRVGRSNK